MATQEHPIPKGGFNFENVRRNEALVEKGYAPPTTKKTGTTIVGVVYKDGVCLGADTRATEGSIVADKNCQKIHYIADNMYCCGAGTSADTENSTGLISSKLVLHQYATGRQPRVATAVTMLKQMLFSYQGHIGAHLILGGIDVTGPSLWTIHSHGNADRLPYVTMGSGSLAAMAVFESSYKDNMTKEEAIELVHQAILSGIFNDLGSGSNVDICTIEKDGATMLRNYDRPNERKFRRDQGYPFKPGTTSVLKEEITPLTSFVVTEDVMDLS